MKKGSVNHSAPVSHKMSVKMDNPNVQKPIASGVVKFTVKIGSMRKGNFKRF